MAVAFAFGDVTGNAAPTLRQRLETGVARLGLLIKEQAREVDMIHHSVDGGKSPRGLRFAKRKPRGWSRKALGLCACLLAIVGGSRALAQQSPTYLPPINSSLNEGRPAQPLPTGTQMQPVAQLTPAQPGAGDPTKEAALGPPRPLAPFGPGQIRLPNLPGAPGLIGSVPKPSPETVREFNNYVGPVIAPANTLTLICGHSEILKLKDVPKRIQVADDAIANYQLLSPLELSLMPRCLGSTVLNLWFADAQDKTKERVLSYYIRVLPPGDWKEHIDAVYRELETEINLAFPDSRVMLRLCGDKLLVCGQAKDIAEATHILDIVRAHAPGGRDKEPIGMQTAKLAVDQAHHEVDPRLIPPEGAVPGVEDYLVSGGPLVVNLLKVPNEQQVMLQVTVAEVNRAAARSIGLNFNLFNKHGGQVVASNVGGLVPTINNQSFAQFIPTTQTVTGLGTSVMNNIAVAADNGQVQLAISALRELNYSRLMAEPTLTTMNGRPARFQAGNLYPIPYLTGAFNGSNLEGVGYIPTGVQLSFTPYITDKDRVRLEIAGEVSDRDPTLGDTIVAGAAVPILSTRNFDTTVELREGQTLAVAGLIQNRLGANSSRVPFFGDLPLIGRLAAFDQMNAEELELVILITPKLVHGMEANCVPPLPGSDIFEPGDLEFYLLGRLESRRSYDYRSPVMTDIHRMARYHHCEQLYITGPFGHCGNGECAGDGVPVHE